MKEYPSIPKARDVGEFTAYVFDKLDGSNLRFEWSKKRGWHKFGTRKRLFDQTDPVFGEALKVFFAPACLDDHSDGGLASQLQDAIDREGWKHLVVFAEFWGAHSIGGCHSPEDKKTLTLFDAAADKRGLMGPKEYLKTFESVKDKATFLGIHNWTPGFVDRVLRGELEGVTFEGVVGKSGTRHDLVMAKAKTQKWRDAIIAFHGEKAQQYLES